MKRLEKKIRQAIFNILGLEGYLKLHSLIFFILVNSKLIKRIIPEIHYLKNLIRPGFYCIDIGAGIGYFSFFLSKYVGKTGKVFSVEPIELFRKIIEKNIKHSGIDNIVIRPYALGEENKKVKMGTFEYEGAIDYGQTRIINLENSKCLQMYDAEMKIPDELFENLNKLDFIKCDVEGYEVNIFPYFTNILKRFKPIIQIELIRKDNKARIYNLLEEIWYKAYILENIKLEPIDYDNLLKCDKLDYYFICGAHKIGN